MNNTDLAYHRKVELEISELRSKLAEAETDRSESEAKYSRTLDLAGELQDKLAEVERQKSAALAALEMWKLYFQCTDDEDAETHGERFTECWTTMEHTLSTTPPKGEA